MRRFYARSHPNRMSRLRDLIAAELTAIGLALTGWFRTPSADGFSMRRTGWVTYAGVFGVLVFIEGAFAHRVIAIWSPTAAAIASVSSLYLLIWIAADAHAVRLYPVAIVGNHLLIRIGMRWRARIPLDHVVRVDAIDATPDGALDLSLISPTVLVTLRTPVEVRGLFGRRRHADRLALTIDDPHVMMARLPCAPTPT
jgi:hypothetical protein